MYEKELKIISDASKLNTLTFFVGAGVSRVSKVKKWSELIDAFCIELGMQPQGNYSNDECLAIPQKYYYSIKKNDEVYYDFLEKQLKSNEGINNVHHLIYALNPNSIITTNFDDLLENAAAQNCLSYKSIATDSDVSSIHGSRYILKIHGDLKHRNVVLKEEDYLNYSDNYRLIETLAKSIFSTNTVVFIGYSLNDYNIKLILNWAKSLLQDAFLNPIFIYTDDLALSQIEIDYQTSRGLSVVDISYIIDDKAKINDMPYEERYAQVLKSILAVNNAELKERTKEELFTHLYELLKPLDSLFALRRKDITTKLYPYIRANENGLLESYSSKPNLIVYFCEIVENKEPLPPGRYKDMYSIICSVFCKANIIGYWGKDGFIRFGFSVAPFGDTLSILNDYKKMNIYVNVAGRGIIDLYKRAYYLVRLKRYEESYVAYKEIAVNAFAQGNYIIYYLAQINRKDVYKIMRNLNRDIFYHNTYSITDIDKLVMENSNDELIFDQLPIEFRNEYSFISKLYTVESLHKNAYEAFIEAKKVRRVIETDTIEMGISSVDTALSRINDNLHFALGNFLVIDDFTEFNFPIRELLSNILYKFSEQKKERMVESPFGDQRIEDIIFDEIDFYCLSEYFSSNEINELMRSSRINVIPFKNMDRIENCIRNIFEYYDSSVSLSNKEASDLQQKMKTCLSLFRYMDMSINLIEYVTSVILKYEFREIKISDKLLFIDAQLYIHNKFSKKLSNTILNRLKFYIKEESSCILSGKKFEIDTPNRILRYCNLSDYISKRRNSTLKSLTNIVTDMLSSCPDYPLSNLIVFYDHVSKDIRISIKERVLNFLNNEYDFELFSFLVTKKLYIPKEVMVNTKMHLNMIINRINHTSNITINSKNDQFSDLVNIAYWCLLGLLDRKDFVEFLGFHSEFDFLLDPQKFDYSNLSAAWLLKYGNSGNSALSKIPIAREKVHSYICYKLREDSVSSRSVKDLTKLLIDFYS